MKGSGFLRMLTIVGALFLPVMLKRALVLFVADCALGKRGAAAGCRAGLAGAGVVIWRKMGSAGDRGKMAARQSLPLAASPLSRDLIRSATIAADGQNAASLALR